MQFDVSSPSGWSDAMKIVANTGTVTLLANVAGVTPGAGGYGPPSERDPVAVERDLANQCIDLATAADAI